MQQALFAIYQNLEKFSEIKCPQSRSFIVTIVERKAIDLYRTKQRSSVIPFEEEFINVPAPSVMDAAVHRTDLGRVMAMPKTKGKLMILPMVKRMMNLPLNVMK